MGMNFGERVIMMNECNERLIYNFNFDIEKINVQSKERDGSFTSRITNNMNLRGYFYCAFSYDEIIFCSSNNLQGTEFEHPKIV